MSIFSALTLPSGGVCIFIRRTCMLYHNTHLNMQDCRQRNRKSAKLEFSLTIGLLSVSTIEVFDGVLFVCGALPEPHCVPDQWQQILNRTWGGKNSDYLGINGFPSAGEKSVFLSDQLLQSFVYLLVHIKLEIIETVKDIFVKYDNLNTLF